MHFIPGEPDGALSDELGRIRMVLNQALSPSRRIMVWT